MKLLATVGIMVPIFVKWPKYFTFRVLDPRGWKLDARALRRIAVVSALGFAVSLALLPRLDIISSQIGEVVDESNPQVVMYRISPALLLLVVALLPIPEEWLFRRGVLRLFRDKMGPVPALLLSSALFGLFHVLNPGTYAPAFISPFAGGVIFGCCYLAQGLASATVVHCGYNAAVFVLLIMG